MDVCERIAISVAAGDGRSLEVVLAGPATGVPLFVHHGTPGAAGIFDLQVEVGAERNVRHIAYSRPGYGESARLPGRSVADCVADVVAIADALGYERFHSIGGSGGGPHSIACAALLPDRDISAAAVASPAPLNAAGLDWTAGMAKENVAEVAAVRAGEQALEEYLDRESKPMLDASGEEIVRVLGDLVSEADRRAVTPELGDFMAEDCKRALAAGVWGWFDDDRAIFADWGFDLLDVRVPLSIWHGAQDRFVPIAHGEWLAAHLPARAHLRPDDGHLSLTVTAYGEILDALLEP